MPYMKEWNHVWNVVLSALKAYKYIVLLNYLENGALFHNSRT